MNSTYRPDYKWGDYRSTTTQNFVVGMSGNNENFLILSSHR